MKDLNFDDTLALSPEELRKRTRSKGWALSAVGAVVYAALRLFRQKPQDYLGICPFFIIGKNWGGVSFGWFFICGSSNGYATRAHEVGHIVQNAKVGGLKMLGLTICSAARYWAHRFGWAKSSYGSWWFEAQASTLGMEYVERHRQDGGEGDE